MLNAMIDRKLARRYWWQLIIRGIIAIIFGILLLLRAMVVRSLFA